jgi:hypothetical protein
MTISNAKRLVCISVIGIILAASSAQAEPPAEVTAVIKAAGDNGAELQKVIDHYQTSGDSLKLAAAFFLIGNMEGHGYATYALKDTAGEEVSFDVSIFPNYDSLTTTFASMENEHGVLDFEKNELQPDIETISAEYLIDQIDLAFRAWRERPWAKYLTFDDFCQYVLPYRGSNEPLEQWRSVLFEKYANIADRMTDPTDPMEAASLINDDIMTYFTFDPRYYYHPTDLGLAEMLETGVGRCEDMTNITIYALRANGLAVTSDYTPAWADAGNNHAWNAILTPDGLIPFMGAEASPGKYNLGHRPAKVYRKTFSHQKQNLVFQDHKQEKVPRWLGGKSYRDVTPDYSHTIDRIISIPVTLDQTPPDSVDIAYLCVFNSGEWAPIDWGRIDGNKAMFQHLGGDLLYLPALYLNEEVAPFGAPFANIGESENRLFIPDADSKITLRLTSTTRRKQETSTDGIEKSFLKPGVEYELMCWTEGDWQSLGKATATDQPLTFDNVPSSALYWLVAEGSDRDERPFSIEDGKQRWW